MSLPRIPGGCQSEPEAVILDAGFSPAPRARRRTVDEVDKGQIAVLPERSEGRPLGSRPGRELVNLMSTSKALALVALILAILSLVASGPLLIVAVILLALAHLV